MKKTHLLLVIGIAVVAIVTTGLLLLKSPESSEPNCDAQYSQLSVSEFSSCADAIESVEAFLSKFSKDEKFLSRCEQARKMEDEFVEMKSFLDKDVSYSQFLKEAEIKDKVFSSSDFETVRKTWKTVLENERERRYHLALNKITKDTFVPYLEDCAKNRAIEHFNKLFLKLEVTSCGMLGEIAVTDKSDTGKVVGKDGKGTFHVNLQGNGLGLVTKSADVTVTGIIYLNPDGTMSFVEDTQFSITNEGN